MCMSVCTILHVTFTIIHVLLNQPKYIQKIESNHKKSRRAKESNSRRAKGPTPLIRSDRFYCRVTLRCVNREKFSPDLPVSLAIGPIIPVESNFDGDYATLSPISETVLLAPLAWGSPYTYKRAIGCVGGSVSCVQ